MLLYLALTLSSVSVCALAIQYAIRLGVMDIPVQRSAHTVPTPKGGGIGIILGVFSGLVIYFFIHPPSRIDALQTGILLGAVAFIAVFSWWDDMHHFSPSAKLGAQILAAALASLSAMWEIPLGFMAGGGFILACAYVIFVKNAINFIDGVNGLAGGTIALSSFIFAPILAVLGLNVESTLFYLLAITTIVFLYFNFPRARIFMGDVGSQPCGLILGWAGLIFARDTSWTILPVLMLSAVLFDVAFTLIRRACHGDRLMQAHRGHLYQIAVRSGIAPTKVAMLHWFFVLWGASIGLVIHQILLAVVAVLLPQFLWALGVLDRAKKHDITP